MHRFTFKEPSGIRGVHGEDLKNMSKTIYGAMNDYTERVSFSSATYDFSSVCGQQSYGERTLTYKFELLCFRKRRAQEKIMDILDLLHWSGRKELYDDLLPDYHYEVREPTVNWEKKHGIYTFSITFKASPHIMPTSNKK